MAALTFSLPLVEFDVFGPDPDAAPGLAAVDAFCHGELPLGGAFLERLFQVFGDVFEDEAEGDLVEAAFGRPLLFVLCGGSDKADEAVFAVAVTCYLDGIFYEDIVETRDAFARFC